jgi:hypothetical protein
VVSLFTPDQSRSGSPRSRTTPSRSSSHEMREANLLASDNRLEKSPGPLIILFPTPRNSVGCPLVETPLELTKFDSERTRLQCRDKASRFGKQSRVALPPTLRPVNTSPPRILHPTGSRTRCACCARDEHKDRPPDFLLKTVHQDQSWNCSPHWPFIAHVLVVFKLQV